MLNNRIVVYEYVCGDVLQNWHLRALESGKALGDILIVGVLTDEAIMEKKPKPVLPFEVRCALVSAVKYVDMIVVQDTYTPFKNIKMLRPDILFESESHSEEDLEKARKCMQDIGGSVIVFPYYLGQSSTKIKQRIIENVKK
jgi:cytidyltransferase-like protein